MTHRTYKEVINAIESSGFYTSFRPGDEGGYLVCVSKRTEDGVLHGTSFLLFLSKDQWYISTWVGDCTYRIPMEIDVVTLSLDWLANYQCSAVVPEEIVRAYRLELLSETEDAELFRASEEA